MTPNDDTKNIYANGYTQSAISSRQTKLDGGQRRTITDKQRPARRRDCSRPLVACLMIIRSRRFLFRRALDHFLVLGGDVVRSAGRYLDLAGLEGFGNFAHQIDD